MIPVGGRRFVMMIAWAFARHAASKFGDMPRDFFVVALRQTWAAILARKIERARLLALVILKRGESIGNKHDGGNWPRAVENDGYGSELA